MNTNEEAASLELYADFRLITAAAAVIAHAGY